MTENVIKCKDRELPWGRDTLVMGILNVTPDSFSDGGMFVRVDTALEQAASMVREGAHIIDIGGESTRPYSEPVSVNEELDRVIPVIRAVRSVTDCPISIDTTKAEVARNAVEAGADMVNDISGLRHDSDMADLVRDMDVPVVLMHMRGTPQDMQNNPFYHDVVKEVDEFFQERIAFCTRKGISPEKIIIDPGIGFGKRFEDNLDIINGLKRFTRHGVPVMVGPSRKAFLGQITGKKNPSDRDFATVGAVAACAMNGASIIRVHNVSIVADALKVIDALRIRLRLMN